MSNDNDNDSKSRFEIEAMDFATGELIGTRTHTNGDVEFGRLQPAKEGEPIYGEVVNADFVAGERRVLELTSRHKGPARVSNDKFRRGHEAIFKKTKREVDLDVN